MGRAECGGGAVWRRSRDEHRSSTFEEVCLLADAVMTPATARRSGRLIVGA
ncbi:hypothetical protein OG558_33965 [Kribbella sp. NBC_01510]|uniref:hypothetical protein n=1 Tax=Kribbella sp. NBC_01510 TaxID=2903581 RepID=UPI00386E28A3